jgi:hypothetical protein
MCIAKCMCANTKIMQQTVFNGIILFHEQIHLSCVFLGDNIINKEFMRNSEEHFNDDEGNNLVCYGSVHS